MSDGVTVRSRTNILIGVVVATFLLIFAAAPVGSDVVRSLWLVFWLGVIALAILRAARMGVTATAAGLTVRNFARDYRIPWCDVASIEAAPSDNVTGAVTTVVVRRLDGSTVIGRGASSYSKGAVERWREQLVAVRPTDP